MLPRTMLLYTFTISHFSEKVRWGFDLAGLSYEEKRLVPGPHLLTIKRIAPKSEVPVLVDGKRVIQGSSAILDYAVDSLGASALAVPQGQLQRVRELEALFDRAFGRGIQRIFYDSLLNHRDMVVDLWSQGGPGWARGFYGVAFGVVSRAVRRNYKIQPDKVEEAKALFRETIQTTDKLVSSSP